MLEVLLTEACHGLPTQPTPVRSNPCPPHTTERSASRDSAVSQPASTASMPEGHCLPTGSPVLTAPPRVATSHPPPPWVTLSTPYALPLRIRSRCPERLRSNHRLPLSGVSGRPLQTLPPFKDYRSVCFPHQNHPSIPGPSRKPIHRKYLISLVRENKRLTHLSRTPEVITWT